MRGTENFAPQKLGTWKGGGEVQSPDMTRKVIPFPQAAPTVPPSVVGPQNRILLNIGKPRIAIDISCQATLLNPLPATVAGAPAPVIGRDRKVRKASKL
jgi:hypothetical protein